MFDIFKRSCVFLVVLLSFNAHSALITINEVDLTLDPNHQRNGFQVQGSDSTFLKLRTSASTGWDEFLVDQAGIWDGFRLATETEAITLWNSIFSLFPGDALPADNRGYAGNHSLSWTSAQVNDFFTYSKPKISLEGADSTGNHAYFLQDDGGIGAISYSFASCCRTGVASIYFDIGLDPASSISAPSGSLLLVSTGNAAQVTEPPMFMLLALGLMGLVSRRFIKI
ncbi:hypothetical protein [Thalassomonas sp. RHCl1]|uniref:hypothetical protein n=1 Tax=Thalassomonas sp. RHCl1 TaxID=2995320 RepID=UPI00248D029C|nr:hypothetical protein [Thalassomonas sp. RHCl1]